jgi:hypothetical protein
MRRIVFIDPPVSFDARFRRCATTVVWATTGKAQAEIQKPQFVRWNRRFTVTFPMAQNPASLAEAIAPEADHKLYNTLSLR